MPVILMKSDSSSSLERSGPTTEGTVTFSDRHREDLERSGKETNSKVGRILWDTGASSTCFDAKVAHDLGLAVIDRAPHAGPLGYDENAPIYEGQVIVNGNKFPVSRASAGILERFGLIALIGRDILSRGTLEYDGKTGIVTFRF